MMKKIPLYRIPKAGVQYADEASLCDADLTYVYDLPPHNQCRAEFTSEE